MRQGGFDGARTIDLIEIGALVAQFAHLIDRGQSQDVADLFTPSGWYGREGGLRSAGRAAIRAAYAERAIRNPQRVCRHLFTNHRIAFDGDDTATGLSTLMLFAGDGATYHYRAIHPDTDTGGIRYVDTHVSYPGRYKGAGGFGPMGPWLVTRDEIPDPHALAISCWHDDVLVTSDNTANLTHHLPAVLAWLSRFMTLEDGDIVSLGTALSATGSAGGAIQNVDLNRLGGSVTITIEGRHVAERGRAGGVIKQP